MSTLKEFKNPQGGMVLVDTSDEACKPFGCKPGDSISYGQFSGVVIGAGSCPCGCTGVDKQLFFKINGCDFVVFPDTMKDVVFTN